MGHISLITDNDCEITTLSVPYSESRLPRNATVTIGDLHANALKLVHIFIAARVFYFDQDEARQYQRLVDAYRKMENNQPTLRDLATTAQIKIITYLNAKNEFIDIIQNELQVVEEEKRPALVRLLGDILHDRGVSDELVLMVLAKVAPVQTMEIIFSNHDLYFLLRFGPHRELKQDGSRIRIQDNITSIDSGISDSVVAAWKEENDFDFVNHMRQLALGADYFANLKLVSYSLQSLQSISDQKVLLINAHACVNTRIILNLADTFGVQYNLDEIKVEPAAYALLLDALNELFTRRLGDKSFITHKALWDFAWMREDERDQYPDVELAYPVIFQHGHSGAKTINIPGEIGLDNTFGRFKLNSIDYTRPLEPADLALTIESDDINPENMPTSGRYSDLALLKTFELAITSAAVFAQSGHLRADLETFREWIYCQLKAEPVSTAPCSWLQRNVQLRLPNTLRYQLQTLISCIDTASDDNLEIVQVIHRLHNTPLETLILLGSIKDKVARFENRFDPEVIEILQPLHDYIWTDKITRILENRLASKTPFGYSLTEKLYALHALFHHLETGVYLGDQKRQREKLVTRLKGFQDKNPDSYKIITQGSLADATQEVMTQHRQGCAIQ